MDSESKIHKWAAGGVISCSALDELQDLLSENGKPPLMYHGENGKRFNDRMVQCLLARGHEQWAVTYHQNSDLLFNLLIKRRDY